MDLKTLRKETKLPLSLLKKAIELADGKEEKFETSLIEATKRYALGFKNNVTRFKTFGYFVSEDKTKGVVVSLLSETRSHETLRVLSDFANVLAQNIHDGICVDEDIDEMLNGVICYLGENVTLGDIYRLVDEDNPSILAVQEYYLGQGLLVARFNIEDETKTKSLLLKISNTYPLFFKNYEQERKYGITKSSLDEYCSQRTIEKINRAYTKGFLAVYDIKFFGI